ncbi:AMP-binding protein [Haliangium sp.]|uniref:AMP-binding protein n=1 Tax=Haliangium sp. TaxID=2663208 RepID=UPI003D144D13
MNKAAVASALALSDPGGAGTPAWLAQSWSDPESLHRALSAHLSASLGAGPKSALGSAYDLYHDFVTRHLGAGTEALRWLERGRGWRSLSFEDLDARCRRQAQTWVGRGLVAGDVVAVVLPFGAEAVIALLSVWRAGGCVCLLPPDGEDYISSRLAALGPTHVVSERSYVSWLGEHADLLLDGARELGAAPAPPASAAGRGSHTYRADEPCALVFSPLRRPLDAAMPVLAEALYTSALRDGLVTFALRRGDRLAAPGFHSTQHQPALVAAALAAGAAYVHVPVDELERTPELLLGWPVRSLGVSRRVRDLLLAAHRRTRLGPATSWQHWFRNPEEPLDWSAWSEFVTAFELETTPASNVVVDSADGGAVLGSRRRPGRDYLGALMNVWPAPGRPWMLADANGSGQEAVGEAGLMSSPEAPEAVRHFLLAQVHSGEYLYAGVTEPRRSGRVYPAAEVLAALAELPFVCQASVVAVLAGGRSVYHRFVLLVFTGAETPAQMSAQAAQRRQLLERVITARVGADALPDRVDLFPLLARVGEDGAVDHEWCRTQFLTGALFRKSRLAAYHHLTALRGASQPPPEAAP